MRVAALYDIHGNLPALEAVLQEIRQARVDHIVAGGDVVVGPMSREALTCLMNLDIPVRFVRGNCEVAVLTQMAGVNPGPLPAQALEAVRWTAQQLDAEHEAFMAGWPTTLRLEIPGLGPVLFCHATPRNENESFTRATPEAQLLPLFDTLDVSVVVCGHTHMQFDRTIGRVRVVNAGSVGMPFGEPGADWLLLGPDIRLRHTGYDLTRAAERIRRTAYPEADSFATHSVLHPPSAEQMMEVFARAELR